MTVSSRKNITAVIGTYTKDGQERNRYMTVGELVETVDKGTFIDLNPYVNFTALPRKDGRLMLGVYAQEKKEAKPAEAPAKSAGVDEEIPF
jgi:hypothetical protein